MTPEDLMDLAIAKCREGLSAGQSPFGCAIAVQDKVVACDHNIVAASTDITAHAEITAIRSGCREVNSIFLDGAVVATTCEPCPMCMSALHWARVETVYFGATIDDAKQAGFNELTLPASEVLRIGNSRVKLIGEVRRSECRQLFDEWLSNQSRVVY